MRPEEYISWLNELEKQQLKLKEQFQFEHPEEYAKHFNLPPATTTVPYFPTGDAYPIRHKVEKDVIEYLFVMKEPQGIAKIKDHLISKYPTFEQYENIQNVIRKLQRDKQVVLYTVNNSTKLSFWCLPGWFDENGQLKREYFTVNVAFAGIGEEDMSDDPF